MRERERITFFSHESRHFYYKCIDKSCYILVSTTLHIFKNRISGVIVTVLASSVVDRVFKSRLGQTNYSQIGICCLSAEHAALRRKSKGLLAPNQDNVSE